MKTSTKKILTSVIFITVASIAVNAQTNVSGGIYASTTWTKANSPYIVTDTVVVFPGVTLTIEPGATVKFADNQLLEIRQATLIALGIAADSITFTSNSVNPTPGIWQEIYLNNPAAAQIDYCIFKYANYALYGQVPNLLEHLYFYNNAYCFGHTNSVIRLSKFYNNGDCTSGNVDSCIYINNGIAINYNGAGPVFFANSTFIGGNTGIFLYDPQNANIINCTFSGNQYGAVVGGAARGGQVIIKSSIFCNNGRGFSGGGIGVVDSIINCNFSQNHIACGTTGFTGYLIGNILTDNDTAVTSGTLISDNYIYHNHVGMFYGGTTSSYLTNNYLCNNTLYNIIYVPSSNGSFPPVCFCDTDSTVVRSKIYDGYIDISRGLLNFTPYVKCDSSAIKALPPINCQTVILTQVEQNNNHSISSGFEIYPNPASDYLTIELPTNSSKTELKIFNMLGELAYSSKATWQKTTIDISNLKSGIYIIQVANTDGLSRQKLIRE